MQGIYKQLNGGTLTVLELGEVAYEAETLLAFTRKLAESLNVPFFTYDRNITHCSQCRKNMSGLLNKCPNCGSTGTLTVFRRYP